MASIIRKADPAHGFFRKKDVYNDRQIMKRERLNGLTATQAFIKELEEAEVKVSKLLDDEGCLEALFWTYPWCCEMWKKFPEVLGLDNTYQTNRFKMPFFQATGVTDQKTVANFAFGLINGEKEHHFQWLCERLDELRESLAVTAPEVVITDKEQALRTALARVFPDTQQQLCVYHLLANARAKINSRWKDEETGDNGSNAAAAGDGDDPFAEPSDPQLDLDLEGRERVQQEAEEGISSPDTQEYSREGMFKAFQAVVYATDHDTFEDSWKYLVQTFGRRQGHILRYLRDQYMPWRKQWAKCYIDRYRNFGQRVNSPVETAHADVKSYLVTGTSDLHRLHEALQTMIENKARSYAQEAARQLQKQRLQYAQQAWLGKLNQQLTYPAIDLLAKQHRFALAAMPDQREPQPLRACTGNFERQYGLPCSHTIFKCLMEETPLRRSQIAVRWWLEKPLNLENSYLDIRDPTVVTNSRGRPRLDAANKKLKIPRYLKIADDDDAADDTDDDDAEADFTQRSRASRQTHTHTQGSEETRGRGRGRGRARGRQPSQAAGQGTRPLNPSVRRDRSQFELEDELSQPSRASRASQPASRASQPPSEGSQTVRGSRGGRGRARGGAAARGRSATSRTASTASPAASTASQATSASASQDEVIPATQL